MGRQRELEEVQARFNALTENTTLAVITIDDDSTIQYANDAVEDVFGYEASKLEGDSLLTIMPERFHEAHKTAVNRYLEEGARQLDREWIELPGRHKDGHEVPLGISFGEATVGDEHRFTAVIRDITERKRREQERETTLELLRDLYDVTTDADLDFEEKVDLLLEFGCARLDLPYGFLSRIETDDNRDEKGTQRIVRAYGDHELLQPGESCPLEQAYCRKTIDTDGLLAVSDAVDAGWEGDPAYQQFDLGSYIGGKVLVDGDLYGTLCFAGSTSRDHPFSDLERMTVRLMSRWLSYELERQQMTAQLERQNDRLQEFASILAHDLRNPLSVAKGRLELAQDEYESDDLEQVADALDRMDALIDDVLTLAREGEAVTDLQPVDLAATIENCWQTVETADATITIETERSIYADRSRLQQLLENLVRNAVEHGGGDVTITVGDLNDGFYVADDGPGIPEDDREEVFASGYTTSADGTGFGLAIVREIAEAHDWVITVDESEDGGARFEITGADFANR
ncbi:PAS domain S-box protein [Halosimplex halobium]|uniref:PAS domain-containing sensor histidine kinase n=1 Tax=Halosimplex halobium TaxID=3396618 RepID=UPI003F54FE52